MIASANSAPCGSATNKYSKRIGNASGLSGGGLKTGQVIGATDARGERVVGSPVRLQKVLATLYRVLDIDPATTFRDHNGRPQYLLEDREEVPGLT